MVWLEQFTKTYPNFNDSTWLYCPEKISEEDYDNVTKLSSLFEALERYAGANYISAGKSEFGAFYTIAFNNAAYKIGVAVGQGTIFYCERLKNSLQAISFDDISQNKRPSNVCEIDAIFNIVYQDLSRLNTEFSIPWDTILNKISEIIKKNS